MSNLPPGVGINDIPGNRPEDLEYEAKWAVLDGLWREAGVANFVDEMLGSQWEDHFIKVIDIATDQAYSVGYGEGKDDVLMSWEEMDARENETS